MVSMTSGMSKGIKQAYLHAYTTSGTSSANNATSTDSYSTGTTIGDVFPYQNWYAKTQKNWMDRQVASEQAIRDYAEKMKTRKPPENPTRFWECEYCGTVNPIDILDCRGKACGHSITKKAMQNAFGVPSNSEAAAKAATPKMAIDGPGAEEVIIDYADPSGVVMLPAGSTIHSCSPYDKNKFRWGGNH